MQAVVICNQKIPTLSPLFEGRTTAGCYILGKSILEHTLNQLKKEDITDVTVVISKKGGEMLTLTEKLREKFRFRIFTSDESTPKIVRRTWQGDEMLITECKGNHLCNIEKLRKIHKNLNSPLTASVKTHHQNPFELLSTPSTEFSYTGVYILSQELVASIPLETKITTMEELIELNPQSIGVSDETDSFIVKTPADLLLANKTAFSDVLLFDENAIEISQGYYNKSGKFLRGVTIIPPVFVGRNTTVGRGTVLESGTILSNNVTVGEGCYIKGSVVGEGSTIGDKASLDNALLDRGVNIMKGATIEKMSVIGAKTTIGNDTTVKSGVKVHSGKRISPSITVCEDVNLYSDGVVLFDDEGAITDFQGFINPSFCANFGSAVASALDIGASVVLSSTGKKSAVCLADALASGLCSAGVNVWRINNATKGELAFTMDKTDTDVGIEVSVDFKTSLRIFSKGGLKITQSLETAIEENLNFKLFRQTDSDNFGEIRMGDSFSNLYLDLLTKQLPSRFSGLNVKINTSDKKTAQLADRLFCERNDVNGETVTFHISQTDEGISAYSEKTGYIFREKLTLIALKFHLSQGMDIALPDTFPDVAEEISKEFSGSVVRYDTAGDAKEKSARKLAGECQNLFVNDPLFLCVKIISVMQENKLSLKKLSQDLPQFYTTKRFVAVADNGSKISHTTVKNEQENSRAVIRPVKNSKGYLIYAQSVNAETASAFCDEIEKKLKTMDN
ncbi:MAG: hypothetical protein E7509_01375 [Ruminococcus sp.]|nr:hypothetical protein [Ruminococcus sp.]